MHKIVKISSSYMYMYMYLYILKSVIMWTTPPPPKGGMFKIISFAYLTLRNFIPDMLCLYSKHCATFYDFNYQQLISNIFFLISSFHAVLWVSNAAATNSRRGVGFVRRGLPKVRGPFLESSIIVLPQVQDRPFCTLCMMGNTLKHKDSFGNSENLPKIFSPDILVFNHDYEGKSSSSNGLLWISFIF